MGKLIYVNINLKISHFPSKKLQILMFTRPSVKFLQGNDHSSKLEENKVLLFLGLVTKTNKEIDLMIQNQENKTIEKINQFQKTFNRNNKTCLSLVQPENKQLILIRECKKYFTILHKMLLKYFKKREQMKIEEAKRSSKKKFLAVKFSKPYQQFDEIKENILYKTQEIFIKKTLKELTQKPFTLKNIQINIPSETEILQLTSKNSAKQKTTGQFFKGGNKYMARKKQEVYNFTRLNKVLENFSQRNEVTTGLHTLSIFVKNISQGKQCLSSCVNEILTQKQQCQVRIESYIDNLTQLIKDVILQTSKIIPKGQGYMDIIKHKLETISTQSNIGYIRSKKYIDLKINYEFQAKIRGFMKICSSTSQILKQFLLSPFVNNVFLGKSKILKKIVKKVMEGRYTFGYLQKEVQNFSPPRDTKTFKVRKLEDKWVSAFRKKFLPKTVSGLRS